MYQQIVSFALLLQVGHLNLCFAQLGLSLLSSCVQFLRVTSVLSYHHLLVGNDMTRRGLSRQQVIPHGLACQSGLRVGDRILEVNAIDLRHATHQEAVRSLLANKQEIRMLVRRDPSPPGMQVRPSNRHTHTHQKEMHTAALLTVCVYLCVCVCFSLQEIVINKQPGEKLGISIRGGAKGHAGNPFDPTDEGIFISKVLDTLPL